MAAILAAVWLVVGFVPRMVTLAADSFQRAFRLDSVQVLCREACDRCEGYGSMDCYNDCYSFSNEDPCAGQAVRAFECEKEDCLKTRMSLRELGLECPDGDCRYIRCTRWHNEYRECAETK